MAPSVATEEEPRAQLVNRRCDDCRLGRQPRPAVVAKDPAPQTRDGERSIRTGDPPKALRYVAERASVGGSKSFRDGLGPCQRFVDNDATVDDEPNATRG